MKFAADTNMRLSSRALVAILVVLLVGALPARAQDETSFQRDLEALTQSTHRLAGTPEGQAAGRYIEDRLREMGIGEIYPLDMVVWQTDVQQCELEIDGQMVPCHPLRPNLTAGAVTPEEGLTGPLVYVGQGNMGDYGDRGVENAIVVMDYDSHDNWKRAFALGAQAVIFVGSGEEVDSAPKHVAAPANLVRLYVTPEDAAKFELTRDRPKATVRSAVTWSTGVGRNVVARIRGTAPTIGGGNREAIVLAANYDTFGVVPRLSPGARDAANVAALLQAAELFTKQPPRRDIILMFLDNQARYHQGAREVYTGLLMKETEHQNLLKSNAAELPFIQEMVDVLASQGVGFKDYRQALTRIEKLRQDEQYQSPAALREHVVGLLADPGVNENERIVLQEMVEVIDLESKGTNFTRYSEVLRGLQEWLRDEADFAKTDVADQYSRVKLRMKPAEEAQRAVAADTRNASEQTARQALELEAEKLKARLAPMQQEANALYNLRLRWDEVRRGLYSNELSRFVARQTAWSQGDFSDTEGSRLDESDREQAQVAAKRFVDQIFPQLQERALGRLRQRLGELQVQTRIDEQRQALRSALYEGAKPVHVSLHVDYNLGDASERWGVVVGDWSNRIFPFRPADTNADAPGWYSRVLDAFKTALDESGVAAPNVDVSTLRDPRMGLIFAPGPFVSSGWMAGGWGIYNVSLMTGYDARVREGQPSDTVDKLNWQRLHRQASEATRLVGAVAAGDKITLNRVFDAKAVTKLPRWDKGRPDGDYAGLAVSGDLQEDRPAAGAMMAVWPGNNSWRVMQPFTTMRDAMQLASYDPMMLELVDANGRFRLIGMREDIDKQLMLVGTLYDDRGNIRAISNQETVGKSRNESLRVDLFTGTGYQVAFVPTYDLKPELLKVLKASIDAKFVETKSLWGQLGEVSFFYIGDQIADRRVKLFQPMGPVALKIEEGEKYGSGFEAERFLHPQRISAITAHDTFTLNEQRLSSLRKRGVTSADLERLHSHAAESLEQAAQASSIAERESSLAQATARSQRVYQPLRDSMDDLVYSVVILLLLAIPFAFAMERLVLCSTSIYGRIGGFTLMFLITFALLYFMHPGFAIATTPIIIFLAFAIILLSSLVIYIVVRKFKTELKAIQGQAAGLHEVEISQAGTMLAAVGMGMSTMRRRPTRTFLTAVTVVMLTFTILCFASFSRVVGVRSLYQGPLTEGVAAEVLVRNLDFSAIPLGVLDMLRGEEGPDTVLAAHWWLTRETDEDPPFTVTRPQTGDPMQIDAIMGIPLEELEAWPELAETFGSGDLSQKQAALQARGVYLPDMVRARLNLEVGEPILLAGREAVFAGSINSPALQRLKHLDGQSVLPVDFRDLSGEASAQGTTTEDDALMVDDVEKDFVHLTADQVVIVSAQFARELGGDLHLINVHLGEEVVVEELSADLAEIVVMPIWAAERDGVYRKLLTVLTDVSGGLALAVPLILGGLIIFGTLLGSISDREREIYTFSALGLSPAHVGVLFFAEATVYAVVGGMGGQLLAQIVALVAGGLARAGYIPPISINYSSTNSLFAIGVVMATVIISAIYPAYRASKSANPGLARTWRMPQPQGDDLKLVFPFTVSAYDITGVVSFLAEHFRRHDDAGLGNFAATDVAIRRNENGNLTLDSELALAPFDLGVTQRLSLSAVPSEIEGVDEVAIHAYRRSGAAGDWVRANKVFMRDLRQQFLLWRTLSADIIERYRLDTLQTLGESQASGNGNGNGTGKSAGSGKTA